MVVRESARISMNRLLRFAFICGVTPLTIGIVILLTWLLTGWHWLMAAGIVTLYGGLLLVFIGAVSLVAFAWTSVRGRSASCRQTIRQSLPVAGVLAVNFPVAVGIIAAVIHLETRYIVTIVNDSSVAVDSFVVSGGGVSVNVGSVPPGSKVRRSFFIKHDGTLTGKGKQDSRSIEGVIDGYVTNSSRGNKLVKIRPDGTLEVADKGH